MQKISISIDCLAKTGLALQQNGIRIIRSAAVANNGDAPVSGILLKISSDPEFFPGVEREISEIPPGESVSVEDIGIALSYLYLSSMTERVRGTITAAVFIRNENDLAPAASTSVPVDIMPDDEWPGSEFIPELLAAFITPNDPAVNELLSRASDLLEKRTGDGALCGYQKPDKSHVLETAKAVYDSVFERNIRYSEPPAGFAEKGQRIRLPGDILASSFATCLDFSLLFAAMLEQCGLHPLVFLFKGHAFAGLHLRDFCYPDSSVDDLQLLRKDRELDDIAVFETTCAAAGKATFTEAMTAAEKRLGDNDDFILALDVKQARATGIRPVSGSADDSRTASRPAVSSDSPEKLPELESSPASGNDNSTAFPPRVERWRSKLLDLSRRNRLLNFKDSRQAVPLVFLNLPALENGLSSGNDFSIMPAVELIRAAARSNFSRLERQSEETPIAKYISDEFTKHRIHSTCDESELGKRLVELYRQTKTDIEEGGVNTLFLCAAFLQWCEGSGRSLRSYRAPLLLIPAKLNRESVKSGFTLAKADEEISVNVTLLEMLRREFGIDISGLDPLPADDSGVDLKAVIRIFREATRAMNGWEVVEDLWLGRLFFNKIIMWDDMGRRLDGMKKSPVVAHLISGGGAFDDGVKQVMPEEVDTAFKPEEIICPMSADSSQLAAILSAGRGKNFVLHGPPGTGKSQTITNLIANLLSAGKTVLFVAEKRAALEVVQKRLKKLGIGPFCLELHSSKSGKADVLAQFKEALGFADRSEPESWTAAVAELSSARGKLSDYAAALHRVYPSGLSPYMAFSEMISSEGSESGLENIGGFTDLDALNSGFSDALNLADEIAAQSSETDPRLFAGLTFSRATEWTPAWESAALESAASLSASAKKLLDAISRLTQSCGFPPLSNLPEKSLAGIAGVAEILSKPHGTPSGFFASSWKTFAANTAPVIDSGIACSAIAEKYPYFDFGKIAEFDAQAAKKIISENDGRNFISAFFSNRAQMKKISACLKPGIRRRFNAKKSSGMIDDLILYRTNLAVLKNIHQAERNILGSLYRGTETDFAALKKLVAEYGVLFENVYSATEGEPAALDAVCRAADAALSSDIPVSPVYASLVQTYSEFTDKLNLFRKCFISNSFGPDAGKGFAETASTCAEAAIELRGGLRCWCLWNRVRAKALNAGLRQIADAVESGEAGPGNVRAAVKRRFCGRFVESVINESGILRDFLGAAQDAAVMKFSHYDDEVAELARRMVIAKLGERLPDARGMDCPSTTELGILKRECEKKSRHKPVRTLLEQIPKIVHTLKPCFLMSPLSVAQYLPPGGDLFDLVVFDEASQVTVWDAIGAMARGKQVIIVGDPMQLPPTTFFQRQSEDENVSEYEIEELESILDECMAAGLQESYLQWHYRSRHESLIAFSNAHYYGNRLFTFPSAIQKSPFLGVSFRHIPDGVYDRKNSRTNRIEAEAVVEAVMERFLNPNLAGKSTGVVTFSQAQQSLIEDMIDEKRAAHPEIERFFSDAAGEPFFVKNLENVQGDERDAILFSVGYAKDRDGKLSMNFGPLNRAGGERRLNVAVTRAKEQVIVFSSITSADIDTGRTQATGALHLKSFIRYAETGAAGVVRSHAASPAETGNSSGLEDEVAEFLKCSGYKIDRRVGRSGYKIDIAVRNPDDSGSYAIGIECDGPFYRDSASARDRDKLRAFVLRGLGWKLARVWSLSWWFDRERAEHKLLEEVDAAIRGESGSSDQPCKFTTFVHEEQKPMRAFRVASKPEFLADYKVSRGKADFTKRQDCFNINEGPSFITPQMRRIIEDEGPICESLLFRRVVKEWGFSRTGSAMEQVLRQSAPQDAAVTVQFGERIFWPENTTPETYKLFRRPGRTEDSKRQISEIPVEEIRNAMKYVISQFQSCPDDTLYSEAAKQLGFARVPPSAKPRFAAAKDILAGC